MEVNLGENSWTVVCNSICKWIISFLAYAFNSNLYYWSHIHCRCYLNNMHTYGRFQDGDSCSTRDPAGGAYDAPPDPSNELGRGISIINSLNNFGLPYHLVCITPLLVGLLVLWYVELVLGFQFHIWTSSPELCVFSHPFSVFHSNTRPTNPISSQCCQAVASGILR